ncbi:MAG TPA: hypothetical protein VIK18_16590, partial [Pirellulales bacterium]
VSRRLLFEHLECRRVFSAQALNLGIVTGNLQIDISDTDFDITNGGSATDYSLADYNAVNVSSSNGTNTFVANDETTPGITAGISWGRIVVRAPGLTVIASSYDHETLNGSTSQPTHDAVTFFDTSMADTFTATLESGGASLDATIHDTQNSVYSNTANDVLAVTANSTAGADQADFVDNAGNAALWSAAPGEWATLTNSTAGLDARTNGFVSIDATSTVANNQDNAQLLDTPGNDIFTAIGAATTLGNSADLLPASGSAYKYSVEGFHTVDAYSFNGGGDTASLTDSGGDDSFVGSAAYSYIELPGVYQDYAAFHSDVAAQSGKPGSSDDTATFEASGEYGWQTSANGATLSTFGADITATNFHSYDTEFVTNIAPKLVQAAPALPSLVENDSLSSDNGESVWTLIGGQFSGIITDANGFNLLGIAVTGVNDNGGTWQDNGGPDGWESLTVSPSEARLLPADGYSAIRFVPNAGFAGTATLTFVAWDRTESDGHGHGDTLNYDPAGAYSSNSDSASITVTSPVGVSVSGTPPAYTEGGTPSTVFPSGSSGSVSVSDTDPVTTLTSATLTITGNYQSGDLLNFNNGGQITGTLDGDQLLLSSSSPLPFSDYETAIESVTFSSTSGTMGSRDISLLVNDGTYNSAAVVNTVEFVDQAPTVAGPSAAQEIAHNASLTFSSANGNLITVADVDADGGAEQLTLTATDGTLTLATISNLTFIAGTGTADALMVFTGTLASINAALEGMVFTPTAGFNGAAANLAVAINDQGNSGAGGPLTANWSVTLNVAADQAPVVSTNPTSLTYNALSSAVAVDPSATVSDADDLDLESATVSISSGYVSTEDLLALPEQDYISGSFDISTGVLTLSGVATVAQYQAALRTVTYCDFAADTNASPRTISIMAFDGDKDSAVATRTFDIVPPITVSSTGPTSVTFNAGDSSVNLFQNVTIDDPNTTVLAAATVFVFGPYLSADDVLAFAPQPGLYHESTALSSYLSLEFYGPASAQTYEAALDSVTFYDPDSAPTPTQANVNIWVEDDSSPGGDAPPETLSITDVPPPTITPPSGLNIAQNQPLTFSSANAITVADAQASGEDEQLTLTPTDGTVSLSGISGTGTNSSPLVVTGTLASINAALDGMVFTPTANFNGDTASVEVAVVDTGDNETASDTISINVAQDQAPVLTTTTTTASFTAGGSPVVVDSGISVADPDNPTLQYAIVTIGGYIAGEDQLTFPYNASDITVTSSGGVYTLTGDNASPTDFQNELDSLTYNDTSSTPNTTPRSLAIVVYDGQKNATATYTIDVNAAGGSGSAPTIFVPDDAQSAYQGESLPFSWADGNAISVADPNIGSGTDTMSLKVSYGTLTLSSTGSLASSSGNGTANLSISGTLAAIDAALDGLEYLPGTTYSSADTLAMTLTDSAETGGPQIGNASVTIGVTAASQQSLAVTASTSSLYYNAASDAVAVPIDAGIAVTDNTTIAGATISISSGYVSGEDFLLFNSPNDISGAWDSTTGVLTLSGPATAADYQAALQAVTYEDASPSPTKGSRAITLTVTDSALNTASAGYTINVIPAGSSPAISVPIEQIGSEDNSIMFAWSNGNPVSVSDPNIGTGIDSMTVSVADGTLDLGTSAGLTGSSGNGTNAINLSGNLAALDAALDGLEYFPTAGFFGNSDSLLLWLDDRSGQQVANSGVVLSISQEVPQPTFSLGSDQSVPTGVDVQQTISGWASGMTAGLPDDSSPPLSFNVSNDNSALFLVPPSIDPAGDLTYTPEPGASGSALVSVQLTASPTGAPPGTSYASTFTITLGTDIEPELAAPASELLPENGVLVLGSSATDSSGVIYVTGDTDTSAQVKVTLTTTWGTFTYADGSSNIYNDGTTETFFGPIADVNADLATLILEPEQDSSGSGMITVSLMSSSTGSQGGTVSVTDKIPLIVVGSGAASSDISVSLPTGQKAPENQELTFSGDTGDPIIINADPTANAIVTITTNNGDLSLGLTDGLGNSIATFTGTVAEINAELDGFQLSPLVYGTAQLTVTAMLVDASGDPISAPTSASTTINVRQAPYFNAYLPLWLQDQPESNDATYSSGFSNFNDWYYLTRIADLLNPGQIGSEEQDTNGLLGVAITGLDTQYGTWQFSPDDGAEPSLIDWTDIDSVSDTNALLLASSDTIRFVPNKGYFGDISDAVTFRLWDETTGTAMTYADVSDNGGVTAYSADTATAALQVAPLVSVSGSGDSYTFSTTSAVPTALVVSGSAG